MSTTNAYCEALGIQVPRVEVARQSPDANYYALLIVALLERGEPITLQEAAKRLEEAGVAPADLREVTIMTVYPTLSAMAPGRWIGRLCRVGYGPERFFNLGKVFALLLIPVAIPLFIFTLQKISGDSALMKPKTGLSSGSRKTVRTQRVAAPW